MAAARILRLKVQPGIRKTVGGVSVVAKRHLLSFQSNTLAGFPGVASATCVTGHSYWSERGFPGDPDPRAGILCVLDCPEVIRLTGKSWPKSFSVQTVFAGFRAPRRSMTGRCIRPVARSENI